MALTHNSTLADSEPSWGSVDKTKLPRNAHADMGDAGKKSTWKYPHHWVKEGSVGEEGVYTSGTMYLHRGGTIAAWAAAQGARSGQQASSAIKGHIQKHRGAIGVSENATMNWTPETAALILAAVENADVTAEYANQVILYYESKQEGVYVPEKLDDVSLMADWELVNDRFVKLAESVSGPEHFNEPPPKELETLFRAGLDIFRVIYARGLCNTCTGPLVDIYMLYDEFVDEE